MITNEQGQVALVHYNSNDASTELPDGKFYYFQAKHGVSLCWVDPADVEYLLSIRLPACCNQQRAFCQEANQLHVNVWNTGNY